MWPFSVIARRRYNRRYRAALAVFTGAHVFPRLSVEEKTRVEDEVNRLCWQGLVTPGQHRRWATWSGRAALRVIAMNRIGISLPVQGLLWEMMLPPIRTRSLLFGTGKWDPRLWQIVM